MRPYPLTLGLGILLLMVVGCAAPIGEDEAAAQAAAEQEKLDAINALVGDWVEAYNAGDSKALTALFAEDAMRLPPEEKTFSGHSRIESEFDAAFEAGAGETTIRLEETVTADKLAFTRGTWAVTTTPEGGESTIVVGKWLNLIALQDDGSWKILRNLWNLDEPD